jgi:hypothetical protein
LRIDTAGRPFTVPPVCGVPTPSERKVAVALALTVGVIVLLWISQAPQGLYNDPTYQLKALQQHTTGQSPSFNILMMPSPADLSRDAGEWVTTWAPGMGLLLYAAAGHVKLAAAVRGLAFVAYIIGCVGWVLWFGLFRMPRALRWTFAAALPLMHYATTPLFQYYTENLAWASVPWVLFGAAVLARDAEGRSTWNLLLRSALLGGGLGLLYWLKYSAVFISCGIIAFFALLAVGKRGQRNIAIFLALVTPFLVVTGGLVTWNKWMGAPANYVIATHGWFPRWANVVDAIGFVPLAMADAEGLLHWIFFKPGHPLLHNASLVPLAGFPFGVALGWLVFHRRGAEAPVWIARAAAAVSALALFAVWTISLGGAGHEARHLAGAAIALIPVALQEWSLLTRRSLRLAFGAAGFILVAVPLLYGAFSVAGKAVRGRNYHAAASGFYNPVLARSDAAGVIQRLQRYDAGNLVWYVTDGGTALDLPGRIVIRHADFMPISMLAEEQYRSSVPMRVNLLLPPTFEQNGKGTVIRASFPQAGQWTEITIEGAEYRLWTATLN